MSQELEDVIRLAKRAGERILEIYQGKFEIYQKEDNSTVTQADFASEKIILSGLKNYDYGFLSEESEDDLSRLGKEKVWIIDPLDGIDGTNDFLERTGEFSVMVGLVDKNQPILGVVYLPVGDKLYFAEKEEGAYLIESGRSVKLEVSNVSNISQARFVVSRFHFSDLEKEFLIRNEIEQFIHAGSTGVKLGLIAEGKADAYLTFTDRTSQWDICAPEVILKEAGGEVTDLRGENFIYNRRELRNLYGIAASNKIIHYQIIQNIEG